jgi:SAM-dependent methyltransferase
MMDNQSPHVPQVSVARGGSITALMLNSVQPLLDSLSQNPRLWNLLRAFVEDGFRGEKEVIERELAPWRDPGQRLYLDLGCGTGLFASCFPPGQYVGIDPAPHYVKYAVTDQPAAYAVMDGVGLGLRDASFDGAIVLGVLHHLPDTVVRGVVMELFRALKPGATLLVMEDIEPPNGSWNIAGRAMHWLDRGGFIRSDDDYHRLLAPEFVSHKRYPIRSGICDYAVYVMERSR